MMKNMLGLSPVIVPVGVVHAEIYTVQVEIWWCLGSQFSDRLWPSLALAKPNNCQTKIIYTGGYDTNFALPFNENCPILRNSHVIQIGFL